MHDESEAVKVSSGSDGGDTRLLYWGSPIPYCHKASRCCLVRMSPLGNISNDDLVHISRR